MTGLPIKAIVAELIGTFVLVFIGGMSVVVVSTLGDSAGGAGVVLPALAHGLALLHIAYTYGGISGAHVNPAVTVGLLIGGKIALDRAIYYIIAQVIGAVIAAALISSFFPSPVAGGAADAGQATGAWTVDNLGAAGVLEFVLTFLLVSVVFQAAAHGRAGNLAGVAIGLTLAAAILAGGPYSGASLNPARTLGPALVAGNLAYVPVYLVAMFLAGIAAGVLHGYILRPDDK